MGGTDWEGRGQLKGGLPESALGLDLVPGLELESSPEGVTTTKPLGLDTEPTLKEFYVNQWSEPRKGQMRNAGRGARWVRDMWSLAGWCNNQKDLRCALWAARSD